MGRYICQFRALWIGGAKGRYHAWIAVIDCKVHTGWLTDFWGFSCNRFELIVLVSFRSFLVLGWWLRVYVIGLLWWVRLFGTWAVIMFSFLTTLPAFPFFFSFIFFKQTNNKSSFLLQIIPLKIPFCRLDIPWIVGFVWDFITGPRQFGINWCKMRDTKKKEIVGTS